MAGPVTKLRPLQPRIEPQPGSHGPDPYCGAASEARAFTRLRGWEINDASGLTRPAYLYLPFILNILSLHSYLLSSVYLG